MLVTDDVEQDPVAQLPIHNVTVSLAANLPKAVLLENTKRRPIRLGDPRPDRGKSQLPETQIENSVEHTSRLLSRGKGRRNWLDQDILT